MNFACGKIPSGGKISRNCVYSVPGQETAIHRAKFRCGWPPVSDVAAVTKARRETHQNLQGWPKLANRSQPLVGLSSPYYGDMWRTYCCLTSFFPDCRYVPYLRRYSLTKLCDGAQTAIFGDFCVLYFQQAACSTFQTCILNSH